MIDVLYKHFHLPSETLDVAVVKPTNKKTYLVEVRA